VKYSRIAGTGSYLPEKALTNFELERMVDTTDEWIRERTGIIKRHIAASGQTCSDLAEPAARAAMEAAQVSPGDIDLILVATTTPDQIFPSTACLLQRRLGIHGCAAFDVQAVCTGFIYALAVADKFIRTGTAHCALVVGSEVLSRILDWSDRNTCVLFGDGAGAVVLQAAAEPGIITSKLHADGDYKELLEVPAGIGIGYDEALGRRPYMTMQGNEVFKFAVRTLGRIADETLDATGMKKAEVDWLIAHGHHHPFHGQAELAGGGDRGRARQYLRRLHPPGPRRCSARRAHPPWREPADGGLRWWLHLGRRACDFLSPTCLIP